MSRDQNDSVKTLGAQVPELVSQVFDLSREEKGKDGSHSAQVLSVLRATILIDMPSSGPQK